jgi:uncharacterized protein with GYD domain
MPTYINLVRWTQKGIEDVRESPNRLDAAKKLFRNSSTLCLGSMIWS